jgi:hypothetical protein
MSFPPSAIIRVKDNDIEEPDIPKSVNRQKMSFPPSAIIRVKNNDIEEPDIPLWKVMSSEPEKYLSSYKKNTGCGVNRGTEKGDFLATKDGWMGFNLIKRLENGIITTEEYNLAIRDYNNVSFLIDKIKKDSKKKRYLDHSRLCIPIKKTNIQDELSDFDTKVKDCIIKLSEKNSGLFTYKTLSNYLGLNKGELVCSQSVRRLWNHYYDRSDVYYNF